MHLRASGILSEATGVDIVSLLIVVERPAYYL